MNNLKEERLKIAVFIDFDNIAIGVKQSLNRNFDVGTVLEAIKEKGQVVTKIAYGDWKRNEDFSKAMTQHAVQMVQRNLTPGGDKNGADIALALDALEMAFTRDHINAFVIVGGDSDFIALVEKLKQYDKVVFVVGGRAFTSVILQKNCHEFMSYENLIGVQSGMRRSTGKTQMMSSPASLETALPLIRRSLKILSDREVSPQLGLLKSTLLQLDSTFSERDYGVSSFRDFTQKLANAGYVNLKQVDRSLLVELKDIPENGSSKESGSKESGSKESGSKESGSKESGSKSGGSKTSTSKETGSTTKDIPETTPKVDSPKMGSPKMGRSKADGTELSSESNEPKQDNGLEAESPITALQPSDATRALQELLRESKAKPHWPLYLRTFKQFLKSLQPPFDEHQFGITSTYDLVRQANKDGLLRVERNRQGILRIYPGELFPQSAQEPQETKATPEDSEANEPEKSQEGLIKPEAVEEEPKDSSIDTEEPKAKPAKTVRRRTKSLKTAKKPAKSDSAEEAQYSESATVKDEPEITPQDSHADTKQNEAASDRTVEEPVLEETSATQSGTKPPAKKTATPRKRKTTATKTARTRKATTARKTKTTKEKDSESAKGKKD